MSSEPAIVARGLGKCYQLYARPQDRLKQFLWRGRRSFFREFWALHDVDLDIAPGEVIGVVGRNGSGKSTLLQLVCGTLTPTRGHIAVKGRVAALLELGAGFNPEFTGRENVFMSAAIMGLSDDEISARYESIVDFSGIRDFIDQPVKAYSSGMYVRLAFAVAISVDPDILVIDEALSVGDGAFARKSFDRIMALKEAGKTILFCSHSTYQIEAICNRALWLREGRVEMLGPPAQVVSAYNGYLASLDGAGAQSGSVLATTAGHGAGSSSSGSARIVDVRVGADGDGGRTVAVRSLESTVRIAIEFTSDPALPVPSVGVCILGQDGATIASAGSHNDGVALQRRADGSGTATLILPDLPLLKGEYQVDAYLLCERGVHVYDHAVQVAQLQVSQRGLELGLVNLSHRWEISS